MATNVVNCQTKDLEPMILWRMADKNGKVVFKIPRNGEHWKVTKELNIIKSRSKRRKQMKQLHPVPFSPSTLQEKLSLADSPLGSSQVQPGVF